MLKWHSEERQNYCEICKQFAKIDCLNCSDKAPELLQENQESWYLWSKLQTQWNVGYAGLIGLNYQSIELLAEIEAIDLTPSIMNKIRTLELETLKNEREKSKNKD